MAAQTTSASLQHADVVGPPAGALSEWNRSEWHQDQFERHVRYARSIGLSPEHSQRYARRQLQAADAARPMPPRSAPSRSR